MFSTCMDMTPRTCDSLADDISTTQEESQTTCRAGCQCEEGMVLYMAQCIPPTECKCYYDKWYKVSSPFEGGSKVSDSCSKTFQARTLDC